MSEQTVPELRAAIKELDPKRPTSKLRKAELTTLLAELESKRAEVEADMTGHWAEQGAGVDPDGEQVFQGAMHEAEREATEVVDQVISEELADVAPTLADMAGTIKSVVNLFTAAARTSAQAVGQVAYGQLRATVRSMGRTVHGRVVDTVLRAPDPDGSGRVCLVVQHEGHSTRRTLHRLVDVQFEPVAS
jgi:hypothetical protein